MAKIDKSKLRFDNRFLATLIVPILIENILNVTIGMADTMMVASAGEATVSGVSLIDSLGALYIFLITAFATGGAVVCSQYLGRKDTEHASSAARQLMMMTIVGFSIACALMLIFKKQLIALLFGTIEEDVRTASYAYYNPLMLSVPMLAISSAAAAILRTMGKTKVSMVTSLGSNLVNVIGNAIFIFGFHMGAFGAGLSTLISRTISAVILFIVVMQKKHDVNISGLLSTKPEGKMISRITRIALPSGFENCIFHVGKILMTSTISLIGTSAIAAYAVTNSLANFSNLGAQAIGLASITVVGQCCGAGDTDQALYYGKKLLGLAYIVTIISCALLLIFLSPLISVYSLTGESFEIAHSCSTLLFWMTLLVWPLAFTIPHFLRAAGDVKFTMIVSILSMWIFRVTLARILGVNLGLGLQGVFYAMFVDWFCRLSFFIYRYARGKWKTMKVI